MTGDTLLLIYLVGIIILLVAIFFAARWVFGIDERKKQNISIINLLTLIAKKHGATNDEIHSCVNHEL